MAKSCKLELENLSIYFLYKKRLQYICTLVIIFLVALKLGEEWLLCMYSVCYRSSFHATSGFHSIPERLNMEQETDASLIALTTHFAQVREGYNRRSIFSSNLASFPARLTPPHL